MFGNRTLTYVSTEGELAVKEFEQGQVKKKGKQAETQITTSKSAVKKQEKFEEVKKKTRNMLLGLAALFVLVISGASAYKAMH